MPIQRQLSSSQSAQIDLAAAPQDRPTNTHQQVIANTGRTSSNIYLPEPQQPTVSCSIRPDHRAASVPSLHSTDTTTCRNIETQQQPVNPQSQTHLHSQQTSGSWERPTNIRKLADKSAIRMRETFDLSKAPFQNHQPAHLCLPLLLANWPPAIGGNHLINIAFPRSHKMCSVNSFTSHEPLYLLQRSRPPTAATTATAFTATCSFQPSPVRKGAAQRKAIRPTTDSHALQTCKQPSVQ